MNPTARSVIVSPADLAAALAGHQPPVLLDASFDLTDADAGARNFTAAHIPGSLYVHLDRDLCAPTTGRNGRHPLPDRADFARTLGALGIGPNRPVVTLDRQGGAYAARLWWMLRWLGHAEVAELDGGFAAWLTAGGASTSHTDSEATTTAQTSGKGSTPARLTSGAAAYPERVPLMPCVEADELTKRIGLSVVLDARSPERFRGDKEPIDAVAGHIPGALNRFHTSNLDEGRFKSAERLRSEFLAAIGSRNASEVIHSCGSGVTACHNLLAMEHAGLTGSLLYAGSWSEWSSDPERPIARG